MTTTVQRRTHDEMWRLLDRALIGAAVFLAMLLIGVQLARADIVTSPMTVPSTTAYHFSSHPMISGTVVTVNDHQMVVNTDQGEQVALEIDTRTMAPRDLAPGMVMRAEFVALEDCRFYAQRITPIRRGMSTNRLQAYAVPSDGREPMAYGASDFGGNGVESIMSQTSAGSPPQTLGEHSLGMAMIATPSTADYQFSTRPMVSGGVVSVNDHRLVVKTDQGQMVALVMDSRTMVPREVTPGSVVRAEFTELKDGRYYAKQVSRIGSGVATREQAYAHTHDSDFLIAQNLPDCGVVNAASGNTMTSAVERRETLTTPAPIMMQSVAQPERPETLPQTASAQPLILLLGLSSLGFAGLVTAVRRLRNA